VSLEGPDRTALDAVLDRLEAGEPVTVYVLEAAESSRPRNGVNNRQELIGKP
jgi:hypothetical protein